MASPKVSLFGTVTERVAYMSTDNVQRYSITVIDDGQYPSKFRFITKDPTICGPADGFAAVGKRVFISGWLNSKSKMFTKKDGKQAEDVRYWLTLKSVDPETTAENAPSADAAGGEVAEDVPF